MKFKVGDRVKCLGRHHSYSPDLNPIAGTKGVVIGVDTPDRRLPVRVNWDNGVLTWAFGDDVVSVLPAHKIVITTDGVTTLARLYDGNKVVKSAEAKCAPSDTYDFTTGAGLAFSRLMGGNYSPVDATQTTKPEQPKHQYKVGDKVKVIGNTCRHHFLIGTIVELLDASSSEGWNARSDDGAIWSVRNEDIEPYTEPKQPRYYSGKVVCVAKEYKCFWPNPDFTVGKDYNVVDGAIANDTGYRSKKYTTLEDICAAMGNAFIPHLGEA